MRKRNFTKQVGLIISEEIYNQIIHETDRREVTISAWIREAIQNNLNRGKDRTITPAKHLDNSLTFEGKEKTK